ncbi:hypothetical protein [Azospirillum sp. TSO5]|uniref:hypothetical protein n=1 Tax=Azospirillum sp. TSO5 TaxID=716760 RepID=UPI000D653325|nr:hypothetical protein [Azospirillum sp. TSO5]
MARTLGYEARQPVDQTKKPDNDGYADGYAGEVGMPDRPLIEVGSAEHGLPAGIMLTVGYLMIIFGSIYAAWRLAGWVGETAQIAGLKDIRGNAQSRSIVMTWLIVLGLIFGGMFLVNIVGG